MSEESEIKVTNDELALFDEISLLAKTLWENSVGMEGLNTDPKMFSNALFKRLWSNHRGYTLLWNNVFRLESDIILRSALEASICIAANMVLKEEFVLLMKRDAAFTLLGQIRSQREDGETKMVRDGEALLRQIQAELPEGQKPAKLQWKELAEIGGVPLLYTWHRMLSGVSSHVTGLSVLDGFGGQGLDDKHAELSKLNRKMHLMMMAGAMLQGTIFHAIMIEQNTAFDAAMALAKRMDALSWSWPGV
ncbi:MAG: hypothetical protein AB7G25_04975 [Sphingomonadaceae bacterium]